MHVYRSEHNYFSNSPWTDCPRQGQTSKRLLPISTQILSQADSMDSASPSCAGDSTNSSPSSGGKLSWVEKVQKAKEFKVLGNESYKSKDYKSAIRNYHKALLYLKGVEQQKIPWLGVMGMDSDAESVPDEVMAEVASLKVDCHNNLAACILQSEDPSYSKVLQYCDEVIKIKPNNTKALYRKGVALYHLNNPDEAMAMLQKAKQLPGGEKDANVRRYIGLCNEQMTKQNAKMKNMYQGMFEK